MDNIYNQHPSDKFIKGLLALWKQGYIVEYKALDKSYPFHPIALIRENELLVHARRAYKMVKRYYLSNGDIFNYKFTTVMKDLYLKARFVKNFVTNKELTRVPGFWATFCVLRLKWPLFDDKNV
jgi:hypothetical protein